MKHCRLTRQTRKLDRRCVANVRRLITTGLEYDLRLETSIRARASLVSRPASQYSQRRTAHQSDNLTGVSPFLPSSHGDRERPWTTETLGTLRSSGRAIRRTDTTRTPAHRPRRIDFPVPLSCTHAHRYIIREHADYLHRLKRGRLVKTLTTVRLRSRPLSAHYQSTSPLHVSSLSNTPHRLRMPLSQVAHPLLNPSRRPPLVL